MKRVLVACLMLACGVALSAQGAKAKPGDAKELLGRWIGAVTADVGEMQIRLTVSESDGALSGTLETMHGDWQVQSVTQKDGKWTLTAKAEDGTTGYLTGAVKDGHFAGDWDFKPRAVGTFDLTRSEK